jgi:hypothetical protein
VALPRALSVLSELPPVVGSDDEADDAKADEMLDRRLGRTRAAVAMAPDRRDEAVSAKREQSQLQAALSVGSTLSLQAELPPSGQRATLLPFEGGREWADWAKAVEADNVGIHRSSSSVDRTVGGKEQQVALQRALSASSELSLEPDAGSGRDERARRGRIRAAAAAVQQAKAVQQSHQVELAAASPLSLEREEAEWPPPMSSQQTGPPQPSLGSASAGGVTALEQMWPPSSGEPAARSAWSERCATWVAVRRKEEAVSQTGIRMDESPWSHRRVPEMVHEGKIHRVDPKFAS